MMKFGWLPMIVVVAGCTVRLGGPEPVEYDTIAIQASGNATAASVAERIRASQSDIALIITRQDSNWINQIAAASQLTTSRPGRLGDVTLAFLGTKPEGDTTLTVKAGNGFIKLHDALYKIDKTRNLDLIAASIDAGVTVRDAVQALLLYVADDVYPDAAVIMAIEAPNAAIADSVSTLSRAALGDVAECVRNDGDAASPSSLRMFYFPAARITCQQAQVFSGDPAGVSARLVVSR